ncbi:MAG: response regulator [Lachnospiraceae bacterium]|nr:response regulator [Lachnospiraceae bacterium]
MYTVVIADDEEELRRALIRKVDWEAAGFQVIGEAENGVEALEVVAKKEPDLLITDIRMPFVNGIELARQVREIRPTMQIVFLSGFDEFTYAQQAIQYNIISYLLKPISSAEMTEEMKKIKQIMDEKFARFSEEENAHRHIEKSEYFLPLLLDGSNSDFTGQHEETILKNAVSLGFLKGDSIKYMRYCVIVIEIKDKEGNNCTSRANMNGIDMILGKYVNYMSFYVKGRIVSLLASTRKGFDKYLHILVNEITQSVERIMQGVCVIGVGRILDRLSGIHEGYLEAVNAAGYSRKLESSVHFIADEERLEDYDQEEVQQIINEVEILIRSASKTELEKCLDKIATLIKSNNISHTSSNLLEIQLITSVYRTVYAVTGNDGILKLQQDTPLHLLFDPSAGISEHCLKFCRKACEIVAEQRKQSSSMICEDAIDIIERQFMNQELSLVSVSNTIAVSPNYLSSLIKKSTGSTFSDLLTKKRIETAKELLLTTPMKVREVAGQCGYKDQHYFSYCFKKYTGMSPNTCRRNHEAENKGL